MQLFSVYERVKDWDCEFKFSIEEINTWKQEPFYIFLLGKHVTSNNSPKYYENWLNTKIYQKGLARLKAMSKTKAEVKPKYIGYAKRKYYTEASAHDTGYSKSIIWMNGQRYRVRLPRTYKGSTFKPKPGFNASFAARKIPYKYNLGGYEYFFGWSRAKDYIDITRVLMGLGNYPVQLDRFYFDLHLDIKLIGAYPYLYYLLKQRKTFGSMKTFIDYQSKRIVL